MWVSGKCTLTAVHQKIIYQRDYEQKWRQAWHLPWQTIKTSWNPTLRLSLKGQVEGALSPPPIKSPTHETGAIWYKTQPLKGAATSWVLQSRRREELLSWLLPPSYCPNWIGSQTAKVPKWWKSASHSTIKTSTRGEWIHKDKRATNRHKLFKQQCLYTRSSVEYTVPIWQHIS